MREICQSGLTRGEEPAQTVPLLLSFMLPVVRAAAKAYQCITQPPSMLRVWPVMVAARSEAR